MPEMVALKLKGLDLINSFGGLSPRRFDWQVKVMDSESLSEEQVLVFINKQEDLINIVHLPYRESKLQLNMKLWDEKDRKLVILPSEDLDELYRDAFSSAVPYLYQVNQPKLVKWLLKETKDFSFQIPGNVFEVISDDEEMVADVYALADKVVRDISAEPRMMDSNSFISVLLLSEYLTLGIQGLYRPWALLPKPLRSGERCLIKYYVEQWAYSNPEKIWNAIIGRSDFHFPFELPTKVSTHIRFSPPEGMILKPQQVTLGEGPMEVKRTQGKPSGRDFRIKSEQAQFYLDSQTTKNLLEESEAGSEPPTLHFFTRIDQSASTRVITVMLYMLSLLPLVTADFSLILDQFVSSKDLVSFLMFHDDGILETDLIYRGGTLSAALALALIASGWDSPVVREFAITQFVIYSFVFLLWVAASEIIWSLSYVALMIGLTALVVNLCFLLGSFRNTSNHNLAEKDLNK